MCLQNSAFLKQVQALAVFFPEKQPYVPSNLDDFPLQNIMPWYLHSLKT